MRLLAVFLLAALLAPQTRASDISIAFTDDEVAVDASFQGAALTLFGAVTGVEDPENTINIVAIIRGPDAPFNIRRLEKKNLIWMAGDAYRIERAPGFYLSAATKPVNAFAPLPDQANYNLHTDYIDIKVEHGAIDSETILAAFLSEIEEVGLYNNNAGIIAFKKGALFTIKMDLPANTPVGDYDVNVYLYRDGAMLAADQASLSVNKVGLERQINEFAHSQPLSYGLFCVAISLFAGWIAALAFRK